MVGFSLQRRKLSLRISVAWISVILSRGPKAAMYHGWNLEDCRSIGSLLPKLHAASIHGGKVVVVVVRPHCFVSAAMPGYSYSIEFVSITLTDSSSELDFPVTKSTRKESCDTTALISYRFLVLPLGTNTDHPQHSTWACFCDSPGSNADEGVLRPFSPIRARELYRQEWYTNRL